MPKAYFTCAKRKFHAVGISHAVRRISPLEFIDTINSNLQLLHVLLCEQTRGLDGLCAAHGGSDALARLSEGADGLGVGLEIGGSGGEDGLDLGLTVLCGLSDQVAAQCGRAQIQCAAGRKVGRAHGGDDHGADLLLVGHILHDPCGYVSVDAVGIGHAGITVGEISHVAVAGGNGVYKG